MLIQKESCLLDSTFAIVVVDLNIHGNNNIAQTYGNVLLNLEESYFVISKRKQQNINHPHPHVSEFSACDLCMCIRFKHIFR